MALIRTDKELDIAQLLRCQHGMLNRDDRIGISVPPQDRSSDVGEFKAPMSPEQQTVIEEGLEPSAPGDDQIIDAHGPDLRVVQGAPITFWHEAGKCLQAQLSQG